MKESVRIRAGLHFRLTLAGEWVDDFLLDTLLTLGETLILHRAEPCQARLRHSARCVRTFPTAMVGERSAVRKGTAEDKPTLGRAVFWTL